MSIYKTKEFGTIDNAKRALLNNIENPTPGKSGANLTLALNDCENVHNLETHKAVDERLKKVGGDAADIDRELKAIGLIFRQGRVPRSNAKGWDCTKVNGVEEKCT